MPRRCGLASATFCDRGHHEFTAAETPDAADRGDASVNVAVNIHEIVSHFDDLSPWQRNVAMYLSVVRGDTLRFPIPAGTVWVKWMSRDGSSSHPTIAAEGPGYRHADSEAFGRWLPAGVYGVYCDVSAGARIRVARSGGSSDGDSVLFGALLLQRIAR